MARTLAGSRSRGAVPLVIGLAGVVGSASGSLSSGLAWLGVGGAVTGALALIWTWWVSRVIEVEVGVHDYEKVGQDGFRYTVTDPLARGRKDIRAYERVQGGMEEVGVVTGMSNTQQPYIALNFAKSLVVVVR